MELIDLHCHLDMMEEGFENAILAAKAAGVTKLVTIGTEPSDHEFVLEMGRKYYPDVYCTLGVHPHQGAIYTDQVGEFICAHLSEKSVIAVGEIGLDYYYNQSPKTAQIEAFEKQMLIAKENHMPVEIHTRDAEADTVEVLKKFSGHVGGIIHCFTGTKWLAEQCLELGFNISISGVVSFKNAHDLRQIVQFLPMDRFHVETDAPFLAPVPMRGKKNTPAYVVHTAKLVAELKGISLEKLCEVTKENALRTFPKIVWS